MYSGWLQTKTNFIITKLFHISLMNFLHFMRLNLTRQNIACPFWMNGWLRSGICDVFSKWLIRMSLSNICWLWCKLCDFYRVNPSNNVAQNVGYWQYSKIRSECVRCLDIYKYFSKEWKVTMFEVMTQSDDDEKVSVDSGYSSNDSVKF